MFELGSSVSYIRKGADGEAVEGFGLVMAVCLDHSKRRVVQIKEGENVFNVDYFAVNPTEPFKDDFRGLCKFIKEETENGNKLIQSTVAEFNKKIENAYNALLGLPLDLEYPAAAPVQSEAA
jgi:hypothetical protein